MGWTRIGHEHAARAISAALRILSQPAGAGLSIALILGLFVVVPYRELLRTTDETTQRRADLLAEQTGLRAQTYLSAIINAIATLSAREPATTFQSEPAFQDFAADIDRSFPGIVAVNWIDDGYTIRWVFPFAENRPAQGANLSDHVQAGPAIRAADRSGEPRMTPGLNLLQGGTGFAVYLPLANANDNRRAGFVNLAFRDATLLGRIFPNWDDPQSALIISNGVRDVFSLGALAFAEDEIVSTYDIPILDQSWRVKVLVAVPHRTLDGLLVIGLSLAVGIGLAMSEVLRRRHRAMESERRLAVIGENAPAAIYQRVLWPDGRVTFPYASSGLEHLLGPAATSDRLRRDPGYIWDRVRPENLDQMRESIERSARNMTPWDEEFRVLRDDGKTIWLNGISRPYRDARGCVVWDGILIDITKRKEAELALAQSEEQLRQLQRMESIGQLTGGIAHDFNNMLTVVLGNLDLAVSRLEDNPRAREEILLAIDASERGAELTRRLLAFARKQPLMPKPLDVNDLTRGVERMVHRVLGDNVDVELDLAASPWVAFCDPAQLESALVNLAVNARDAMSAGGRLTMLTANCVLDDAFVQANADARKGEYVAISVTDTGSGMSPEVAVRVFEPFFTTKEFGKGTGLGLAMVYGFVKQSGGHVVVDSAPGRGTTVTLYLPRARATPDSQDAA